MSIGFYKWKALFREKEMRLILFLKEKTKTELSNRLIKKAIELGFCKVNFLVETFASKKLKQGDVVELKKDWEENVLKSQNSDFFNEVLYEDEFFKIVDKKEGFICDDKQLGLKNCMLVHRLDKPTSGVLILAKSLKVKDMMKDIFREKKVKKTYLAVVDKAVEKDRLQRKSFFKRDTFSKGKVQWVEAENGLEAITVFERVKKAKDYSVLKCFPLTGRTHQLRVHLNALNHPILGDYQYARKFIYPSFVSRLMLHSLQVEFQHPVLKNHLKVRSKVPKEFDVFLKGVSL